MIEPGARENVRIAYGVFGYGRGHATRALSVLPTLARRHELLILAGGDAYDALESSYPVTRVPHVGYVYGENGRHSLGLTLRQNLGPLCDAVFEGRAARAVRSTFERFRPHVAVSDAEPFTHQTAARLGVPRVSFDHAGLLAHCRVEVPGAWRVFVSRDAVAYLLLMGRPQRVIVSSFFHAEPKSPRVRWVGPLLRPEVHAIRASEGNHVLAYFNQGQHQLSSTIEAELQRLGLPVIMYGSKRVGSRGNLHFRAPSNTGFLADLASARAVLSTAGNQLVGECIHFRKPLLAIPENCLEQQINAAAVRRLGIGDVCQPGELDASTVRAFLLGQEKYRAALSRLSEQHRPSALEALEESISELGARRELPVRRSFEYA